ncbi:DTW domain-containing protein [Tamilnaduibacter salinus]|uniref:tRNA-uridine aminocarboxypropyltransferase n=1 Tax=Tamilnaduibacter salinus TaxID=1484056 RepID=A0A2A2I546_9GAMM|nr:DTW domain-containing protein [Tamilnaduibacter salinus]
MGRALCAECGVHRNICVCDQCAPIEGAPMLWLLQDPKEAGHSKGTARIVDVCLPSARRIVCRSPEDLEPLRRRAQHTRLGVLFPSPHSTPVEEVSPGEIREWIVLDGTWRKARRLLLSNPWLRALPAFHFSNPPRSAYRIRKAPTRRHLATAEAVAALLDQTAPDCLSSPLRNAVSALVERQLQQMPQSIRHRYE